MFPYNELTQIQIEITNRCQASCPMCDRNINGGIDNPNIKTNDWTINDFKTIFTRDLLLQLKKIDFCGVFGEPILNNDLILMCEYARDTNPNIHISIYTNGSARNSEWWKQLYKALPSSHKVEFALDGLEDTHSLYRIGTNFNKVLDNAKTFIEQGGKAHWMYLQFKHNQHQVETARTLAKDMNFEKFTVKNSKRFSGSFSVLNRDGNVSHCIEQPTESIVNFVRKTDLQDYQSWKEASEVNCMVLKDKEVYIDAHFTIMPCCILASFLYSNYDQELYEKYNIYEESSIVDAGIIGQQGVNELVKELGGLSNLNSLSLGIKYIMDTYIWQQIWDFKWKNKSSPACIILCSKSSPFTSIEGQKHVSV